MIIATIIFGIVGWICGVWLPWYIILILVVYTLLKIDSPNCINDLTAWVLFLLLLILSGIFNSELTLDNISHTLRLVFTGG